MSARVLTHPDEERWDFTQSLARQEWRGTGDGDRVTIVPHAPHLICALFESGINRASQGDW